MQGLPGWQPLRVCGGYASDIQGLPKCDFWALLTLIKNGITDLVLLSTLLAVAVFVIVGIKLLTSGGNTSVYTEAKTMLWKVVMGYVWILGAWLIVYTVLNALLKSDFNILLKGS